jgi:hypothetical protein
MDGSIPLLEINSAAEQPLLHFTLKTRFLPTCGRALGTQPVPAEPVPERRRHQVFGAEDMQWARTSSLSD